MAARCPLQIDIRQLHQFVHNALPMFRSDPPWVITQPAHHHRPQRLPHRLPLFHFAPIVTTHSSRCPTQPYDGPHPLAIGPSLSSALIACFSIIKCRQWLAFRIDRLPRASRALVGFDEGKTECDLPLLGSWRFLPYGFDRAGGICLGRPSVGESCF